MNDFSISGDSESVGYLIIPNDTTPITQAIFPNKDTDEEVENNEINVQTLAEDNDKYRYKLISNNPLDDDTKVSPEVTTESMVSDLFLKTNDDRPEISTDVSHFSRGGKKNEQLNLIQDDLTSSDPVTDLLNINLNIMEENNLRNNFIESDKIVNIRGTAADSLNKVKNNVVNVEMVKKEIEQNDSFPGKADILDKLTGYQRFGPDWILREGYTDTSGKNFKYVYVGNRRLGEAVRFETIDKDLLKMILQHSEDSFSDNRRSFDVEYDSYEYYEDYDYDNSNLYVDHNIYYDGEETVIENNVNENISDTNVPDEVFGNVMYAMASEIAETSTIFNHSIEDVSQIEMGESLESIIALPLVENNSRMINDSAVQSNSSKPSDPTLSDEENKNDQNSKNEEKSHEETENFSFYQSETFGPEADQTLGESFRSFKKPFANHIHMDVQHHLHLKK